MPDPWSKFFWSDWEADQGLRLCSLSAQGLWMRMLCVCARHEPKGYLAINGHPLAVDAIARLAGVAETEAENLLAELDRNGVFSRNRSGCIYSRRMVRDEKRSQEGRKHKKRGLSQGNENVEEISLPSRVPTRGPSPQKPEARYQKEEDANASLSELRIAVDAFNATAADAGWPQCQRLSKAREAALKARLAECGGVDGWRIALAKARASPHLTGQNDRGWTASFDFLTQASSFAKLMEGNYDPRPRPDSARPAYQRGPGGAHDSMVAGFAYVAGREPH